MIKINSKEIFRWFINTIDFCYLIHITHNQLYRSISLQTQTKQRH